jgi:hypothetical protein
VMCTRGFIWTWFRNLTGEKFDRNFNLK